MRQKPYKEPVFLFTSCSLRFAAWAGWYSAFGDEKNTQQWIHQAHVEWAKELGAARRFSFLRRHNNDIYDYINPEKLKEINDAYLRTLKQEIARAKKRSRNMICSSHAACA